jgi:hypothetical protein
MGTNIFLLNPSREKKSTLDIVYKKHVNKIIQTLTEEEEIRWEIYSVIIQELIKQGKQEYLSEIKYRITDGENPNRVILDIMEKESDSIDASTWFFKRKLEEFLEEDYYKQFLQ